MNTNNYLVTTVSSNVSFLLSRGYVLHVVCSTSLRLSLQGRLYCDNFFGTSAYPASLNPMTFMAQAVNCPWCIMIALGTETNVIIRNSMQHHVITLMNHAGISHCKWVTSWCDIGDSDKIINHGLIIIGEDWLTNCMYIVYGIQTWEHVVRNKWRR